MPGLESVRAKIKRRFSHKDPNPDFDDEDASADEETSTYVNREVEDAEKEGDKYPEGRPNSFLNRMISHGNKKTEDELARDAAAAKTRESTHRDAVGAGQTMGAAKTTVSNS
ncbi:hypothetical protein H2198_008739 [Neophaeococcomyces mojaviensis]|uniref:Uncharacterized protein n=1 Tax=Neophaeococcomyces mojaviensis TaxID=3383035 RepID=A0ACC2ZWR0_9EURO|nr:hypothetical protein H2198_008739 [Knufia sp. JES_112]